MNLRNTIKSMLFLIIPLVWSSCDHNRNTTGWQYFDDMVKSPAYESYTPNLNFADGKTMQAPPEGTVPRGFMKYPYAKTDEDRLTAGLSLENPFLPSDENLKRGQKVYASYCASCHGDKGDGQGQLYTSKKFPYPPASLLSGKILDAPDGEIFHVISVGWGIMAEHGSMIKPDDRWRAVLYIRNELQKN